MTAESKKLAQKAIAIVVIVAVLDVVGISPTVIVFFVVAGVLVWRVVRRSERHEIQAVFDFYVSADDILRDDERRWYGFEIAEVINRGERVLISMADPPPLIYFALGALYHRTGDFEKAVEHFGCVVDGGLAEEHCRTLPSALLRRYVEMLRTIERRPGLAPQALAAVRSLERARRSRVGALLADSHARLERISAIGEHSEVPRVRARSEADLEVTHWSDQTLSSITPQPPIIEVLREVYREESPTNFSLSSE